MACQVRVAKHACHVFVLRQNVKTQNVNIVLETLKVMYHYGYEILIDNSSTRRTQQEVELGASAAAEIAEADASSADNGIGSPVELCEYAPVRARARAQAHVCVYKWLEL